VISHLSTPPDSFMPVEGLRQGCKGYALTKAQKRLETPCM
jgi:hypothetical protein